jgi:hypothetical protein
MKEAVAHSDNSQRTRSQAEAGRFADLPRAYQAIAQGNSQAEEYGNRELQPSLGCCQSRQMTLP